MGRKKLENKYNAVFGIRLTKEQKEILEKNEWLKKEMVNRFREELETYVMPAENKNVT